MKLLINKRMHVAETWSPRVRINLHIKPYVLKYLNIYVCMDI